MQSRGAGKSPPRVLLYSDRGGSLLAHTGSANEHGGDNSSGMNQEQVNVILKRFEAPDETRRMAKGKFELVRLGALTIGRATYEPGWKWSEHVGPIIGARRCTVEHVGLVLSGTAAVAFDDDTVIEMRAGELFYIPPVAHDSWVVGNEPYVSLHFSGADHYAK